MNLDVDFKLLNRPSRRKSCISAQTLYEYYLTFCGFRCPKVLLDHIWIFRIFQVCVLGSTLLSFVDSIIMYNPNTIVLSVFYFLTDSIVLFSYVMGVWYFYWNNVPKVQDHSAFFRRFAFFILLHCTLSGLSTIYWIKSDQAGHQYLMKSYGKGEGWMLIDFAMIYYWYGTIIPTAMVFTVSIECDNFISVVKEDTDLLKDAEDTKTIIETLENLRAELSKASSRHVVYMTGNITLGVFSIGFLVLEFYVCRWDKKFCAIQEKIGMVYLSYNFTWLLYLLFVVIFPFHYLALINSADIQARNLWTAQMMKQNKRVEGPYLYVHRWWKENQLVSKVYGQPVTSRAVKIGTLGSIALLILRSVLQAYELT